MRRSKKNQQIFHLSGQDVQLNSLLVLVNCRKQLAAADMARNAAVANAIQSMYGMSLNYLIEILKNQTFLNVSMLCHSTI